MSRNFWKAIISFVVIIGVILALIITGPGRLYQKGVKELSSAHYRISIESLEKFLQKYPDNKLVPSAQDNLAIAYVRYADQKLNDLRNNENEARAFLEEIQQYYQSAYEIQPASELLAKISALEIPTEDPVYVLKPGPTRDIYLSKKFKEPINLMMALYELVYNDIVIVSEPIEVSVNDLYGTYEPGEIEGEKTYEKFSFETSNKAETTVTTGFYKVEILIDWEVCNILSGFCSDEDSSQIIYWIWVP